MSQPKAINIAKAYDFRGTVPDQLNEPLARSIGWGFATFLKEETKKDQVTIAVGRDMRAQSPLLSRAFREGAIMAGARVLDAGLCTTPMLYAAVGIPGDRLMIDGGAMVTASHNGPKYNGMKLCRAAAVPISVNDGLREIAELADACENPNGEGVQDSSEAWDLDDAPPAPGMPNDEVNPSLWRHYCSRLMAFAKSWEGVRVAVDCANGMGVLYLPILQAMGAEVHSINDELDGNFPAHEANPIKAENLVPCQDLVAKVDAKFGISFDGDADRVVYIDEKAQAIPADLMTALLATAFLKEVPGSGILYDLRSTHSLREIVQEMGGSAHRERVGHSFMKARMRQENCIFGGEVSGHYYFRDCFFADSSLRTCIAVANLLMESGKPLSELVRGVKRYHTSGEVSYHVSDKDTILQLLAKSFEGAKVDWMDGVTVELEDWWFNVRPSNTEPLLRLNLECRNEADLETRMDQVRALIGGTPE